MLGFGRLIGPLGVSPDCAADRSHCELGFLIGFGPSLAGDSDDVCFRNARREAEHYSARFSQTLEEREPHLPLEETQRWAMKSGSEHIIPRGVGFGIRVEEERPAKFN
ncbi:uncharacterized protein LOC141825806 [Curcuma longa]|uniref:uncharacterized protein LOC141825806 n=1 Tax=Curcuma longa TaxID=136217 RepID=UPI003D9F0769